MKEGRLVEEREGGFKGKEKSERNERKEKTQKSFVKTVTFFFFFFLRGKTGNFIDVSLSNRLVKHGVSVVKHPSSALKNLECLLHI